MYSNNDYRNYLSHHGVVGMHWGIRRYQPYGEGGYNPKKKGKEVGEAKQVKLGRAITSAGVGLGSALLSSSLGLSPRQQIANAAVSAGAYYLIDKRHDDKNRNNTYREDNREKQNRSVKEREDRIRKKETARLEKRKQKEAAILEKSKKREDRAFNEKYKKNFVKSYNEATNKFNRDIKGINEKYKNVTFDENFSTKEGQEYVKEVSAMWKKHYRDSLYKNVGEGTRNIGKDWVENASFMNEYDRWIKK